MESCWNTRAGRPCHYFLPEAWPGWEICGLEAIRNAASDDVISKSGVAMPPGAKVGNAFLPVSLEGDRRGDIDGKFAIHPGDARFDGDGVTWPSRAFAAAKPVRNRHAFHAAAETQRQSTRWPDRVAESGAEQVRVRYGITGWSVHFLRGDQVGRLQVSVGVPDNFL